MALAVTHILVVIIILDLLRHYVFGKQKFPRYLVVLGGIAGLLPDIDVPVGWLLTLLTGTEVNVHRLYTHSLIWVLLFLLFAVVRQYQHDKKAAAVLYVIAFGWLVHLVLDCFYGGPINSLLWPGMQLLSVCPAWDIYPFAAGIDAILLVVWLVHEEVHKRIKDYL